LDARFINSDACPSKETDIKEGTINQIIGMKVQSSALVPNGTAYAIDPLIASKMLLKFYNQVLFLTLFVLLVVTENRAVREVVQA